VATFDAPDIVQFHLILELTSPVSALLACLRSILRVGDDSGLLLFAQDPATKQPRATPFQTSRETTINAVVVGDFLYYHLLPDLSQEELASKVLFRLSVYDASMKFLREPILLMPNHFSAADVYARLVSASIVPEGSPLRLLQLNGSRIVKEIDPEIDITSCLGMQFRVEIIPEDQRAPADQKVRVSFSRDSKAPMSSTCGTPFWLTVVPEERFSVTKERILAIAQIDAKRAQFAYTNNCLSHFDRTFLTDTDVLADLLSGRNTMLYVLLPGAQTSTRPDRRDGALRIYN
jgi:hypothetical protein